jgi:hypothetical protein
MNSSGRIREHFETVELWPGILLCRPEGVAFFPDRLNIGFYFLEGVWVLAHGTAIPPLCKGYLTWIS